MSVQGRLRIVTQKNCSCEQNERCDADGSLDFRTAQLSKPESDCLLEYAGAEKLPSEPPKPNQSVKRVSPNSFPTRQSVFLFKVSHRGGRWMTDLLKILGVTGALAAFFQLANYGGKHWSWPAEFRRKLIHIGMGAVVIWFPWIFDSIWPVWILATLSMAAFCFLRRLSPLRRRFGRRLSGSLPSAPHFAIAFHAVGKAGMPFDRIRLRVNCDANRGHRLARVGQLFCAHRHLRLFGSPGRVGGDHSGSPSGSAYFVTGGVTFLHSPHLSDP